MISSLPAKKKSLLFHNLWKKVLNNIYGLVIPQKELDTEQFNYSLSLSSLFSLGADGLARLLERSNVSSDSSAVS